MPGCAAASEPVGHPYPALPAHPRQLSGHDAAAPLISDNAQADSSNRSTRLFLGAAARTLPLDQGWCLA
jgi:hypothetical protein